VFEAGHDTIGGVEFEASLGADYVRDVDDLVPYVYNFVTALLSRLVMSFLALLSIKLPVADDRIVSTEEGMVVITALTGSDVDRNS
jgi:hypothetical protein